MFKQLLQKVESIDTQTSLTEQIMVAKSSDEVKVLLKFTPDDNYATQKRLIILEFVASWCGLCDQVKTRNYKFLHKDKALGVPFLGITL